MILFDVNVMILAANTHADNHLAYKAWFTKLVEASEPFGVADIVLSAFIRITTNRKVFPNVSTPQAAIAIADKIRSQPNCVVISPGPRHWQIFVDLCQTANAQGNLVPDAYLAALAIESGSEWITADRGFARFPGLRWRHPLDTH
jgi:uncharacterized protein